VNNFCNILWYHQLLRFAVSFKTKQLSILVKRSVAYEEAL
jgi:hypothetical protein